MIKVLVAASVAWPLFLTAGAIAQSRQPGSWLAFAVYTSGGSVCHQRDDRSFHTNGAKWPVCTRCSGLYLTAPIGALAALASGGGLRRRRDLTILAVASAATAITFAVEHLGLLSVSSVSRFVAALPFGAALAWVIVRAARGPETGIG